MTINTVIIDKNLNSLEILKNKVVNITGFNVAGCFENFSSIDCNIKDIDLILFDISSKESDEIINQVKSLMHINNNIMFIATSYEINSELVAKTLNEGVKDFLLKPILDNILNASFKKIIDFKENTNQKLSNTICIFSNKGGCGKTSLAVNFAYEIANLSDSDKVCIVDLNRSSEDAATFLDIEPKYNIEYIFKNLENADENQTLSLMNRYKETNLYVLSAGNKAELGLRYTTKNVLKLITYIKNVFRWVIIDISGETDELNLSVLNNSDLILLIGLMNMVSIRNSQKTLELFEKAGFSKDKVKLILNRYIQNSQITVNDIEKVTGKEVFEKIPNNYLTLIDAINIGKPVGEINPQSNIAKAYKNLAKEIINTDFLSINKNDEKGYNVFNLMKRMGE